MNSFSLGHAGGGNVGFAVSALTELEVFPAPRDAIIGPDAQPWLDERRLILSHVVAQWRALEPSATSYRIVVHRANPPHIGLASSAALQLAAWSALSLLDKRSLGVGAVRTNIAATYRETVNGTLAQGFTTGLSSFLGLFGGFAVINTDLTPRFHSHIPTWTVVVVSPRSVVGLGFGDAEIATLTGRAAALDKVAHAAKLVIVEKQLIPAIASGDLVATGAAVAALQSTGSKLAEVDLYGTAISGALASLRKDFECVFMSAVGPGIVVLSRDPHHAVVRRLRDADLGVLWSGSIDNIGVAHSRTPYAYAD